MWIDRLNRQTRKVASLICCMTKSQQRRQLHMRFNVKGRIFSRLHISLVSSIIDEHRLKPLELLAGKNPFSDFWYI